jgi:hypothetical protein
MNTFTVLTFILSFVWSAVFTHDGSIVQHIHAATPVQIDTTNVFNVSAILVSAGATINGTATGPYVYNETLTGYGYPTTSASSSSIGYNITATETAILSPDRKSITINNGILNFTNINGTAADALYSTFTGVANATTLVGQVYGKIIGGAGKYLNATGAYFSNGTIYTYPTNNGAALTGNGTLNTNATVLLTVG